MSDRNNMKLFALNSNHEIAQKIAETGGVPLGKLSSRQFSDGEIQVNIEESVRGYDVYIIQSTSYPVSNHLMELLIMVDACVRASAHSINVVLPYFGYARQDRIASSREPLTAKLVANMLVKAGVSRVLTLDLHAVQVQGFFDIPVDNLYTIPLFAKHYSDKGLLGSDVVVVSPKNSGVKRARSLAEYLDAPSSIQSSGLPFGQFAAGNKKDSSNTNWSIGDIALHKKWGEGTVLEVSGSGDTQELKINFPEVGLKKLLASVAPIEKKI